MKRNSRLCIYPKDVQQITGKSYRQSVRILQKLRKRFNKPADSYVSVTEFCIYSGLDKFQYYLQHKMKGEYLNH